MGNLHWAGWFNGSVFAANDFLASDSIFKTNVKPISKSLSIIDSLKPVSFIFDTATANAAGLYLPGNLQYGFVAQDVEKILPDLVTEAVKPPQFDTLGNEIHSAFTFKALNYNAFTGILTQGIKELDSITKILAVQIDTIKSTKDSLDYDFLLSGSNNHPVLPTDIGETKYTMGHLNINYNSAEPLYVLLVENDSTIPHFSNKPTALFRTDATGFTMTGAYVNVLSAVENVPDVPVMVIGVTSAIHSQPNNQNNSSFYGFCDGSAYANYGSRGYALDATKNYGIYGEALTNSNTGYGARGYSRSIDQNTSGTNYGVLGSAENGDFTYGGYFKAFSSGSNYNTTCGGWFDAITSGYKNSTYGIYASASNADTLSSNYAGYFNGDVYCVGTYYGSDIMLKKNITPLSNALSLINQLNSKQYTFKTSEFPQMNLPSDNQFGLIAQEVELILPELVKDIKQPAILDTNGNIIYPAVSFKGIKYEALIPILIEAVKELNTKNDSLTNNLKSEIVSLKNVINNLDDRFFQMEAILSNCCISNNKMLSTPSENDITVTEVELANHQAIVLDQNVPNPFKENTVITYFIPDNIKYAQIIFTDNYGKIMKTVDITAPGQGMLKVYASNLSSGIYQYSLIVDGKVAETKKMMCGK